MFNLFSSHKGYKPYWTNLPGQLVDQAKLAAAALGPQSAIHLRQAQNTSYIFRLVRNNPEKLGIPKSGEFDLAYFMDKAYGIGDYENIWSVEGLGHVYSQRTWILKHNVSEDAHGILTDGQAANMPAKSLTMMHAGLGLCRRRVADEADHVGQQHAGSGAGVEDVHQALQQQLAAGLRRLRAGIAGPGHPLLQLSHGGPGAACARRCRPHHMGVLLARRGPRALLLARPHDAAALFSPWIAAEMEAPNERAFKILKAGISWPTNIVNMRHPEVFEDLIVRRGAQEEFEGTIRHGVAASTTMAMDITPGHPLVKTYLDYRPKSTDSKVQEPVGKAGSRAGVQSGPPVSADPQQAQDDGSGVPAPGSGRSGGPPGTGAGEEGRLRFTAELIRQHDTFSESGYRTGNRFSHQESVMATDSAGPKSQEIGREAHGFQSPGPSRRHRAACGMNWQGGRPPCRGLLVVRLFPLRTVRRVSERDSPGAIPSLRCWPLLPGSRKRRTSCSRQCANENSTFPILVDADGAVAAQWFTQQTPRAFLIDAGLALRYRGAIDNFQFPDDPDYAAYLEPAISDLLAGRPVAQPETSSFGCAIQSVYYNCKRSYEFTPVGPAKAAEAAGGGPRDGAPRGGRRRASSSGRARGPVRAGHLRVGRPAAIERSAEPGRSARGVRQPTLRIGRTTRPDADDLLKTAREAVDAARRSFGYIDAAIRARSRSLWRCRSPRAA